MFGLLSHHCRLQVIKPYSVWGAMMSWRGSFYSIEFALLIIISKEVPGIEWEGLRATETEVDVNLGIKKMDWLDEFVFLHRIRHK
jgi:hypothetical protein